jgi:hypothetical protein
MVNLLCDVVESVDHLLFTCHVWTLLRNVVWPDNPSSVLDLLSLTRYGPVDSFETIWIGATAVMWALWNIRNKLIF